LSGGATNHALTRPHRAPRAGFRRDLRDLAAAGLCQRVYGGALPVSPAIAPSGQQYRTHTPGGSGGGIPHHARIDGHTRRRHNDARVEVYLIGGRLFKHSAVACGAAAVEAAQLVNADLFLLGVTGVHAQTGLTTDDSDEAAIKRALASRAADTYVLASSEKIGAASRFAVLPLAKIAGIVTDAPADTPALRDIAALSHVVIGA
jgi:DeoR/GlpR family transcriptional regulator of sugar metabolism